MTRKPKTVIRFEGELLDISGLKFHRNHISRIEIYGGIFKKHEVFVFEKASVRHPETLPAPKQGRLAALFNRIRHKKSRPYFRAAPFRLI